MNFATSSPATASPEGLPTKSQSWQMFDRIAPTYDLLNRLLSMGIDRGWRRRLTKFLPEKPDHLDLLDLATGTGDQLFTLWEMAPGRWRSLTGTDLSENMLGKAKDKSPGRIPEGLVTWRTASAQDLPYGEAAFDVATMSFGIRNVPEPQRALGEIYRVLRPGGRALILEFSLPKFFLLRWPYLFYFRYVLPWIGGKVSGDAAAYRYLNRTVESFPYEGAFLAWMEEAGFRKTRFFRISGGIACLYLGDKVEEMEAKP
jgi:demethylmenaquinone methyltransferase / 2-methoxy-6-polyprenyl-1,4-benzoquinol methylase